MTQPKPHDLAQANRAQPNSAQSKHSKSDDSQSANTHGGKRDGAGRKTKYDEPSKVIRIPLSREEDVKRFLSLPKIKINNEVSSIISLEAKTRLEIPVAMQKVAAGFPSPAQDYIDKTIDLNEYLIKNQVATFIIEVESLSLLNAGIDLNDKIIVDRSLTPKHDDIVLVLIDNDFTLKRLVMKGSEVWLAADNPDYPDIHFKEGQTATLWGVVTSVIKKFR